MGCNTSKPAPAAKQGENTPKEEPKAVQEATLLPEQPQEKKDAEAIAAPSGPAVKVEIASAKGLRNADFVGKSTPYCAVQLVGPKPESKLETKTHENFKEPVWEAKLEVPGYAPGDALFFTVKDKDMLVDDILGKAVLTEAQVKEGFDGELQLEEAGEGVQASIKVKVGAMGTVVAKVEQAVEEVKDMVAGEEVKEEVATEEAKVVEETGPKVEEAVDDAQKTCMC